MRVRAAILAAGILTGVLAPAAVAGANPTVCVEAQVTVNGDDVLNEAQCHPE